MRERIRVVAAVVRDPNLRRVQTAFLGYNMTEYATWIAILVFAYGRGGAAAAGIVAMVQLIPSGIVAPFAAFAGDRFRRERVLLAGYVIQAVSLGVASVALAMDLPIVLTYGIVTVASASLTFTRPAQAALLPGITRSAEDLTAANAVSGLAESAGIFVGPFIAGLLLSRFGPASVYAVFSVVSGIGALLVSRLRVEQVAAAPRERIGAGDVVRETLIGFRVLRRERTAGLLVLALVAGVVVVGALDILFVALAIDVLGKGEGWAGFLNSAFGLGGIVGAGLSVALVGRRRLMPPLVQGSMLFGAPIVVVGAAPAALTAPFLFAATGAGRSVSSVAGNTLLQRTTPDDVLSRVFGVFEGLAMFALAIGSVGASSLVGWLGIRGALVVAGAFVPATTLLLARPLLAIDRAAKAPDPEALALLRRLPIFAPLSAPAIERVMAHLVRLELPAGEVLIREGEEGDRFYVIVEGDVAASRGGAHLADRHAGDYIGEIALMRDVPRTATVTALTDLRLLALDREPFLEAVTGYPQSRERLEAVIEDRLADQP
jgi:MFS family permease